MKLQFVKKKFIPIIALFLLPSVANAVIIYGNAGDYIDETLTLKVYLDEIIFTEKILDTQVVDSLGDFEFSFELPAATTCFFDLGAYRAIFFIEPSKSYLINLPPNKPLTEAQKFNPYFKPQKIALTVRDVDSTDINLQIAHFDKVYDYSYVKCSLYSGKIDSIRAEIENIESIFANDDNNFFRLYRQYKYVLMMNMNEVLSPALAISYFAKLPVSYGNIAFWEAFNTLFNGFFDTFGTRSPEQIAMDEAIYAGDYEALSTYLKERFGLIESNFRELIILKGLYDAYFSDQRNAPYILKIMSKWQADFSVYENHIIWENVLSYLKSLAPKTEAYNFKLQDEKGKTYQLSDFKGKYVYLNFANTRIALSKKDFGILERYGETYEKDLYVVNIFTDYSRSDMSLFLKSLNPKNTTSKNINLYWNADQNLITKYQIINIPTYFLIDRSGELLLVPAPTPDEDFEQKFEAILQKEKLQEPKKEEDDIWK